ncbi:MAG: hypothetical protein ACI9HK_006136 [Pirellulaceae bacterium]
MVHAQEMENRRVKVMDAGAILDRFITELIGYPVMDAALDAAAGKLGREGVWIVIAASRT